MWSSYGLPGIERIPVYGCEGTGHLNTLQNLQENLRLLWSSLQMQSPSFRHKLVSALQSRIVQDRLLARACCAHQFSSVGKTGLEALLDRPPALWALPNRPSVLFVVPPPRHRLTERGSNYDLTISQPTPDSHHLSAEDLVVDSSYRLV